MQSAHNRNSSYLAVWEFRVRSGMEHRFEKVYGQGGVWVQFFSTSPDYIVTELIRDVEEPSRYLTLDFWTSRAAYEAFREQNREQYAAIDGEYEKMTEGEHEIGRFEIVR